ncbi:MAG TPA: alkaline phosphatase PhoX [Polyangiaceae bacterium]|nr:alkaline phosphatase PhoX [Polyangiaceae bacterium]
MASVIASATPAHARPRRRPRPFRGYGELVADPAKIVDLPAGFSYRIFSRAGDPLTRGGVVPSAHDGMAAFSAGARGTWLVRNHELNPEDVAEDGLIAVPPTARPCYDPEAAGGTTTLLVGPDRQLLQHQISLAGTLDNCGGGPSPWDTWLSCEETDAILEKPHGYIFEVDPRRGGNPEPIVAMGRFEHEAVSFDRHGRAYLTEDASEPLGCIYRFTPRQPLGGRGSLHKGGLLEALCVEGIDSDLSVIQEPGTRLRVSWIPVPNPHPLAGATPVREQVIPLGATPIKKAEGTWLGYDGSIWFVSSYAGGPLAEDPEDVTAAAHAGQIWRYDPQAECIELVAIFPVGSPFDGPDNITAGPHGFAIACTDGEVDNWLVAIGNDGRVAPFAFNALNDVEFAGATFSPDGQTLFANIQEPGLTLAIWGPWESACR